MTEKDVINAIKDSIGWVLDKDQSEMELTSAFTYDLGADSLEMEDIIHRTCTECNVSADIFEDANLTTIDDMVTLVCKELGIVRNLKVAILWLAVTTKKRANTAAMNNILNAKGY